MPARIKKLYVSRCKWNDCRDNASHEVRDHSYNFVGNYCEYHGNMKVGLMDLYETSLNRSPSEVS